MMAAARAYQSVNTTSKVQSADSRQLITILFDEALTDLMKAKRAIEAGNLAAKSQYLSHATTLVAALEMSLDFERGGEIAQTLASVYRFVRARILRAGMKNDAEQVAIAAQTLGEIASAWAEMR